MDGFAGVKFRTLFFTFRENVFVIFSAHYGDYFALNEAEAERKITNSKGVDTRAVSYAVIPAKSPLQQPSWLTEAAQMSFTNDIKLIVKQASEGLT